MQKEEEEEEGGGGGGGDEEVEEQKRSRKDMIYLTRTQHNFIWLHGVGHMVKDHSARRETRCCHYMCYSFRLAARVLLHAPSHSQDSTYHSLCYTSRGEIAEWVNHEGSFRRPMAPLLNDLPRNYISLQSRKNYNVY